MDTLTKKIRIIHIEDLAVDVELVERELKKGGLDFEKIVVMNGPDLEKALDEFNADIILSDHSLPTFNSNEALKIIRERQIRLPFILITCTMTDELAVNIMKEGADDYIIKDRLQRLPTAVISCLEKYKLKKQKQEFAEQVERNEKRFRAIIEKSNDMITLSDKEGRMLYGSPSITKLFGYSSNEIPESLAVDFIHPDNFSEYVKKRKKLVSEPGRSIYLQMRLKHKNRSWIWCESTITNMLNEPGINALVSNFRNITEKKLAEEQRDFERNNLNALINNIADLMWSVDTNFNILSFNLPFSNIIKQLSGITIEKGTNIFSLGFPEEQLERFKKHLMRAFMGEEFFEIEVSGDPINTWAEISYYPIRNGEEIIGTACHSRDISERKKAEAEREKLLADIVQRSKNLEQFTYIVSHNLRSPIANILGLSNILKGKVTAAEQDQIKQFLFSSVEKLDDVVKDLNKILQTRTELTESKEEIDLPDLIRGIESSFQYLMQKENIVIHSNFSSAQRVTTIKSYLHSIFFNLISNSIKYRQTGQTAVIRIKSTIDKNNLRISFKDNGTGIDLLQHGEKIFGLYKRFHQNFEGKGMGLFMVKTQLEVLGGNITVESTPNVGTEFIIELPI